MMLYGWTLEDWAIGIPWARRNGLLAEGDKLDCTAALKILTEYECRFAVKPGSSSLVEAPKRETDYSAAQALLCQATQL